jgi:predicted enzyme related to lactoylglutathione lyase
MGVPPNWLAYVAVPDVDATAKRATELGGKLLREPEDIPTIGRFAVVADPQGAVLCAFQPGGEGAGRPEGPPAIGEFSWHELATTDHEAAFAFYSDLFGWKKGEAMDMGEMGVYQLYGRGDLPLGGMFNRTEDMPGPPAWLYYVRVESVDDAAERVKRMGGKILNGPMDVPGGDRIVQCMDPQGAAFALHQAAG